MEEIWAPAALADALEDPLAYERWSVLTGHRCLTLDLREPATSGPTQALQKLGELPAITIGWVDVRGNVADGLASWGERVDVWVATEAEHRRVIEVVEAHPLASLALVQLLRHSNQLSIHDGLNAESWVYATLQGGAEFAQWLAGHDAKTEEESSGSPIHTERQENRLRVVLDRPEKRNAFSAAMRDAFCEILVVAQQDPGIEEVELRGAGPSFCSGGDLDEFGTTPDPATAHAIRSTRNPGRLLAPIAGRVHARIHGACVGAGIELPAFCGRVTAREGAFFQLPEVGMGLVPGAGGTVSLPRRIGRQRTAWMALTGERVSVESALAWGLIDAVEKGS